MTSSDTERLGPATLAIHGGEAPDTGTGASAPNIVMSTTFVTDPDVSFSIEDAGDELPFVYTRWGNPTIGQLERKLALLEDAEACVAFGRGMAAIAGLFFHLLRPGDHLVMSDVCYAGASELVNDLIGELGIEVTRVDASNPAAIGAALRPATRLLYLETPCNPLVRLTDLPAAIEMARAVGARVAVDSTFATPLATRPLAMGADYVIHSLTKYLGGHGDAVGGAVLGAEEEMQALRNRIVVHMGGVISPFNAWLIMRGLATLPLRMRAHQENALEVGRILEDHPAVTRVIYPGLPSHPQHDLAGRQMENFGGMLTFQVRDGRAAARAFAAGLKIIHYAVSLGHQRSLLFYLPTADLLKSSFLLTPEEERSYRRYAGEGIFRFSVGLEDSADLISDLSRVLTSL